MEGYLMIDGCLHVGAQGCHVNHLGHLETPRDYRVPLQYKKHLTGDPIVICTIPQFQQLLDVNLLPSNVGAKNQLLHLQAS